MPIVAVAGSLITPVQSDAQIALRAFLLDLFPGASVIAAQPNRVPEPSAANFILMTPLSLERLSTNFEQRNDVRAVGSIAGTTLTVTAVTIGSIVPGNPLDGTGVTPGTFIVEQTSGPTGGPGAYTLNNAMNTAIEPFSVGTWIMHAAYRMRMQLDFHSADYTAFSWAQTAGIVFRSDSGVRFFADLPSPQNNVRPLYADSPSQRPFINDQQQYEWRWGLDAHLQINQTVLIPQDYADQVRVGLIPVDNFYPTNTPTNAVVPAISGTYLVGQTVNVNNGAWSGSRANSFRYQWQIDGSDIGGATGASLLLTAGQVGGFISCVVTATNNLGSTSVSAPGGRVALRDVPLPPTSFIITSPPSDNMPTFLIGLPFGNGAPDDVVVGDIVVVQGDDGSGNFQLGTLLTPANIATHSITVKYSTFLPPFTVGPHTCNAFCERINGLTSSPSEDATIVITP